MQLYFAPMEGITDSVYRRLHHRHFGGPDRYYMPFISPTMHRCLTPKENRELPMADSETFSAIPQILTKNAEDFLWAARQCMDRGYSEVNLNLGCPSGTVVAKGKGSGMLSNPDALDRFLDTVCSQSPVPVSVKTRLGIQDPQEFLGLLDIFNQYPISELIIHPRVRKAFYKPPVHQEMFRYATEHTHLPLCYNGDICSRTDLEALTTAFPNIRSVMVGRAFIANPGLFSSNGSDPGKLMAFHDDLVDSYTQCFGHPKNAVTRMKDNWHYLQGSFEGGEKLFKQLRKTTDPAQYRDITRQIFQTLPFRPEPEPVWIHNS